MKKNNYKIKKLFIIFFILFCFIFISLEQTFSVKLEKNAQYSPFIFSSNQPLLFFCFGTDPLNYPTLQFSLVDLDLAIKFLFNDEKIPFESLQDEYDQLRLKYKSLLEAQFQGFKYYFAKELRQIKNVYLIDTKKLDDDEYIKNRFRTIYYGNDGYASLRSFNYLIFKSENDIKIESSLLSGITFKKLFESTYNSGLLYPLYHFCRMLLNIERFKNFFVKYNEKVNSLISNYEFEKYFKIYCDYFNIRPNKNIVILFDFLEYIYFLKEPSKKQVHPDSDSYKKSTLFAFTVMNTFTFSFLSLKNKSLLLPMFFHELTHFFQLKSNWLYEEQYSSLEDSDKRYFTYKLPDRISDFSGWNKFLSSFHSSGKYIFCEFDAEFTSLEISSQIMYKEMYSENISYEDYIKDKSLLLNIDRADFVMQFYILLLQLYKEYCKKNNIEKTFYINGCNPDIDMNQVSYFSNPNNDNAQIIKDNLYNFLYYEIFKNRDQILKKIHRAIRYFSNFLYD